MALWFPLFPPSFLLDLLYPQRKQKGYIQEKFLSLRAATGFFSDTSLFIQPTPAHLLPASLSVMFCAFYSLVKTLHLPLKNHRSDGEAQTSTRDGLPDGKF